MTVPFTNHGPMFGKKTVVFIVVGMEADSVRPSSLRSPGTSVRHQASAGAVAGVVVGVVGSVWVELKNIVAGGQGSWWCVAHAGRPGRVLSTQAAYLLKSPTQWGLATPYARVDGIRVNGFKADTPGWVVQAGFHKSQNSVAGW